ncbi:hypothetical protein CRG98_008790 [Punica granatum]|uniref:Uncharacterized protein n=1 Tax=Punica granatum TaxID=22663 RepID=A0A2I0KRA1_PUNGR|nr:hypothetical protein CRG98_008790 [Punica granatum]
MAHTCQDPSVPRPEQTRKRERKFGKSENNPVREKRVNDGCARLIGPRTVTTSSRGRVRVVRNPLNAMARLAEVVGGNGTREGLGCARLGVSGPGCACGWNGCWGPQIENLSPEMDLGDAKYVG